MKSSWKKFFDNWPDGSGIILGTVLGAVLWIILTLLLTWILQLLIGMNSTKSSRMGRLYMRSRTCAMLVPGLTSMWRKTNED